MATLRVYVAGGEESMTRLTAMPAQLSMALRQAMQRSLDIVTRRAVESLRGPVLRVKTGRLWQSVAAGNEVTSDLTGRLGTNVEYAAAHEFGFTGAETVRPHRRRMTTVFGIRIKQPRNIAIGAYSRNMNIPERPYMRPALRDSQADIVATFRAGLAAALGAK